jgi:hypothetical protein
MKRFEDLTLNERLILEKTGLLWEIYPDAQPVKYLDGYKHIIDDGDCTDHGYSIPKPKPVAREELFKAVDESNQRFENYTKEERQGFGQIGRSLASNSRYEFYPPTDVNIKNPYERPKYFLELHTWDGKKWTYKMCERVFILPEEDYYKALESSGDDAWMLLGVEGHPYTLAEGDVNPNENSFDFETIKYLKYTIDALNEKVQNDNLKKVSENWTHKSESEPYYECRKCNRRLEELQKLGKAKFCGDFWKCIDCDNDITKDLKSWFREVVSSEEFVWNTNLEN